MVISLRLGEPTDRGQLSAAPRVTGSVLAFTTRSRWQPGKPWKRRGQDRQHQPYFMGTVEGNGCGNYGDVGYVWSGQGNWRWEWQRPFNVSTDSLSLRYLRQKQIPPVIGYKTEFLAGPEAEQELLRCIPGNMHVAELWESHVDGQSRLADRSEVQIGSGQVM